MSRVSRKINDKRLLKLIGRYLRAGVMIDGQCYPTRVGMPQGGPLSPLLSNVLLDDLDKELEYRGHCFARYCDDFVILVGSQRAGERVMESITRYLERRLKLTVNQSKSKVVKATEAEFLGFTSRDTSRDRYLVLMAAFFCFRFSPALNDFVVQQHVEILPAGSWATSNFQCSFPSIAQCFLLLCQFFCCQSADEI